MVSIENIPGELARLSRVLSEYGQSYAAGQAHFENLAHEKQAQLVERLDAIEQEHRRKSAALESDFNSVRAALQSKREELDVMEAGVNDPRYHRAHNRDGLPAADESAAISLERLPVAFEAFSDSINTLNSSPMPKWLAKSIGYIYSQFRSKKYNEILTQKSDILAAIGNSEVALTDAYGDAVRTYREELSGKLDALKNEKLTSDADLAQKKKDYFNGLKLVTLDGVKQITIESPLYSSAKLDYRWFEQLLGDADMLCDRLFWGTLSQSVSVADDGFASELLKTAMPGCMSDNLATLDMPITTDARLTKSACFICKNSDVSAEQISEAFASLALQMPNLYADSGLELYFADRRTMGSTYSRLAPLETGVVSILRRDEELHKVIKDLSDDISERNRTCLRDIYSNIFEYNAEAVIKRRIKMLFINDVFAEIDEQLFKQLLGIIRNGAKTGIFVWIRLPRSAAPNNTERKFYELWEAEPQNAHVFNSTADGTFRLSDGDYSVKLSNIVYRSLAERFIRAAGSLKHEESIFLLGDARPDRAAFFSNSAANGIDLPVGIDERGEVYTLRIDAEHAFGLIAGNPNSGKSALIHAIILQAAMRYPPEELQISIADLKHGSEFRVYQQYGLKSVQVVLDDTESDIAQSFLAYYKSEIARRSSVFSELAGKSGKIVNKYEEYRLVGDEAGYPTKMLPRLLIIVDEFQSLFESGGDVAELVSELVKQGRAYGISLFMASQRANTDSVRNAFTSTLKDFFVHRVLLKSPQSAAKFVMSERPADSSSENPAISLATMLKPGQAIFNDNSGQTVGNNTTVQCYYAENALISSLCGELVAIQGRGDTVLLNSEERPKLADGYPELHGLEVCLGRSNRLHYDVYTNSENSDCLLDDMDVTLDFGKCGNLLVTGSDANLWLSVTLSAIHQLIARYPDAEFHVYDPASGIKTATLRRLTESCAAVKFIANTEDFGRFVASARERGNGAPVFLILVDPANDGAFVMSGYSQTDFMADFAGLLREGPARGVHVILYTREYKELRSKMSYAADAFRMRLISVGDTENIRVSVSDSIAARLVVTQYNIPRDGIVKAYYFNKDTNKFGRFRSFHPDEFEGLIGGDVPHDNGDEYFSGLSGNTAAFD
ncbi:MAG: hypothetical protein LBN99_08760 [Oscillospiraceae bacterium]|nr:hypothetical protein [Oscillospiraceae bacterium]